jgi:ribokinase
MNAAGLDLSRVQVLPDEQTLYAICLVYPDGSGGNLTVDDSACARVDAALIESAEPDFVAFSGEGIALALPEVSLAARAALLRLGERRGFYTVASFTTEEIASGEAGPLLDKVDLVALNVDEAAALAGVPASGDPAGIAMAAVAVLRARRAGIQASLTAGSKGSWVWDGEELSHIPALEVELVSTAGAGDAHLAGILAGLAAGLSLNEAHELGVLVAGLSVTSPHTIHRGIDRKSLAELVRHVGFECSVAVSMLIG